MRSKERLYAVVGGIAGAIITLIVCSFFPIGVHSQADRFGEIECTRLTVVGVNGEELVSLESNESGGVLRVMDKNGWRTGAALSGTMLAFMDKDKPAILLTSTNASDTENDMRGLKFLRRDGTSLCFLVGSESTNGAMLGVMGSNNKLYQFPKLMGVVKDSRTDTITDENDEITVYVTKSGSKYHTQDCRWGNIPLSLSDARKRYSPCKMCAPPQ